MSQRVYFCVHGRVQGVNFRNYTQRKAGEHNVTGWCRNTADEKVEGEAQGDELALANFFDDVNKGPPAASVRKLDKEKRDPVEGESLFHVRR